MKCFRRTAKRARLSDFLSHQCHRGADAAVYVRPLRHRNVGFLVIAQEGKSRTGDDQQSAQTDQKLDE